MKVKYFKGMSCPFFIVEKISKCIERVSQVCIKMTYSFVQIEWQFNFHKESHIGSRNQTAVSKYILNVFLKKKTNLSDTLNFVTSSVGN
jgi:hypothetical protein